MHLKYLACVALTATSAQAETVFEAKPLPDHHYTGGWVHYVGGGVAGFDCNDDNLPELYAAGGESPAQLMINTSQENGVSFAALTPENLALTGVTGAYPLDIDGDNVLDLAILRVGPDILMRGLGNCKFEAFDLGFESDDHWTTAFSARFEAGNAMPTLAFGTYVDRADPNGPFETCDDTLLYRPEGETYAAVQPLTPGFCALSMLFSDWARTGHADLRVSNDRHYYVKGGQEQMWAMEDTPRLYTPEEGWRPYLLWGMGIASRDITGDGFADVMLTSMGDQKLQYFETEAVGPTYTDATFARGTSAHRPFTGGDGRPSTGWHAAFGDVNNDGLDDIFIAKGNVEQMPVAAMLDPNNLLIQQPGGNFVETAQDAGIASLHRSRGAVLADLNLDGKLDLAVVNRRAQMELYENTSAPKSYLLLDVRADAPNTRAIGAHVELRNGSRTWVQEITVGGGHAGGFSGPLHFGLGDLETVELRVVWPDQSSSMWTEVTTNQTLQVTPENGITITPLR